MVHLPQNKFESILRSELLSNPNCGEFGTYYFGYEALDFLWNRTNKLSDNGKRMPHEVKLAKVTTTISDNSGKANRGYSVTSGLTCDYLVAADGASSLVRKALGIRLDGLEAMHTLMNIHFKCKGLRSQLQTPRPAMLYFVFNEVGSVIWGREE